MLDNSRMSTLSRYTNCVLLGVVMSKNMVLPRILHILDYEKQGVCAYIPLFGGGIDDFVIMFQKYY